MKITLLTVWDESFAQLAARTNQSKLKYCAKHGYTACLIEDKAIDFHPMWLKIKNLIKVMESNPDWILWMDADAFITNEDIKVETLLKPIAHQLFSEKEPDLVITRDHGGINAGVFLIRCCDEAKNFLQEVYKHRYDNNDPLGEQESICDHLHLVDHQIVRQRTFNSYLDVYGHNHPEEVWHEGDFVLHLPGMSMGRRMLEVISRGKKSANN